MTAWHTGFRLTWLQRAPSILQGAAFPSQAQNGEAGNTLLGALPAHFLKDRDKRDIFHQPKHRPSQTRQHRVDLPSLCRAGQGGCRVTLALHRGCFPGPHGKATLRGPFSMGGHKPKCENSTFYTLLLDSGMAVTFSKKKKFFLMTSNYVCMSGYVHMSAGAQRGQRLDIPAAGVTGVWESADMNAGTQTWVL